MNNISSEDRLPRILGIIDQNMSQLNNRLTEIENRISTMEPSRQESSTILSERQIPAERGQLGGRTFSTSATGGIERLIHLPTCDICGTRLEEQFVLCRCGKKACSDCVVKHESETLCINCVKERLPLSKKCFLVLVSVANEVDNVKKISRLTKMSRDDVHASLNELLRLDLVAKEGFSIFRKNCVTDNGMAAIDLYRAIYGSDSDITHFDAELRTELLGNL